MLSQWWTLGNPLKSAMILPLEVLMTREQRAALMLSQWWTLRISSRSGIVLPLEVSMTMESNELY
jgi:hypothetical protein